MPRAPAAALTVSVAAFTLALFGTTVVNVALPAVRRDLGGSVTDLQWVANGYTLVLASLLLTMGALCDQRGARRVLLGGLGVFGGGAVLGLLAPTLGVLVAAQVVLGAGAAALIPASLALIGHAYPDPRARARAIGIYSAASGAGVAAGPVAGGVLIDAVGWRGVFAFDLPVVLAIGALALARLDETPATRARHLDLPGQVAAIAALAALSFGFVEGGALGWTSPLALSALAVAVVSALAFVRIERRSAAPMLPLALFSQRAFSVTTAAGLLVNFAVYGLLFVLSLYLQDVRGLSALEAGTAFTAMMVPAALAGAPAGRLTAGAGARLPAGIGGVLGAAGALVLLGLGEQSHTGLVVAGLVLLGLGGGLTVPALTAALVMEMPPARVGVAAAAFTASRQTGGMLGVAVLGAMVGGGAFLPGMRTALVLAAAAFAVCGLAALQLPRAGTVAPASRS